MQEKIIMLQSEKQDQTHFKNITKDILRSMDKINLDLDTKENKIRTLE
jgi:hypothetical protein